MSLSSGTGLGCWGQRVKVMGFRLSVQRLEDLDTGLGLENTEHGLVYVFACIST